MEYGVLSIHYYGVLEFSPVFEIRENLGLDFTYSWLQATILALTRKLVFTFSSCMVDLVWWILVVDLSLYLKVDLISNENAWIFSMLS